MNCFCCNSPMAVSTSYWFCQRCDIREDIKPGVAKRLPNSFPWKNIDGSMTIMKYVNHSKIHISSPA